MIIGAYFCEDLGKKVGTQNLKNKTFFYKNMIIELTCNIVLSCEIYIFINEYKSVFISDAQISNDFFKCHIVQYKEWYLYDF